MQLPLQCQRRGPGSTAGSTGRHTAGEPRHALASDVFIETLQVQLADVSVHLRPIRCMAMHAQLDLRTGHEWRQDPPSSLKEGAAVFTCTRIEDIGAQVWRPLLHGLRCYATGPCARC